MQEKYLTCYELPVIGDCQTVYNEALEKGKSWSEVKRMAIDRTRWQRFVDALCPIRDNRR
jgi:hypothetical protein